jgi:hypothetical protein
LERYSIGDLNVLIKSVGIAGILECIVSAMIRYGAVENISALNAIIIQPRRKRND